MNANFIPIMYEGYDCIQRAVATIFNHTKIDYFMISIGRLEFSFKNNKSSIGEGIRPYNNRIIRDNGDLFGVVRKPVKKEIELIRRNLMENAAIIVECDMYDCSWTSSYNKYHFIHFFLLCDYDVTNQSFYILDPFFSPDIVVVEADVLIKKCKQLFVPIPKKKYYINDYYKEIQKDIITYVEKDVPEMSYEMFNCILHEMDYEKEIMNINPKDIFAVSIIDKVRMLATNRIGYSIMLNHIYEICIDPRVLECAKIVFEVATKWKKTQNYLVKAFYSDIEAVKLNLNNLLNTILESERKMIEQMQKVFCSI